ncbi:hypothetical protein HCU40_00505 [Pseudanabaena biceps]|nr:hypothetical protein [Pseudanabaena biceps]
MQRVASNPHYEINFEVFSAEGAENLKIGFVKASLRLAFTKPIFNNENCWRVALQLAFLSFVFFEWLGTVIYSNP